MAVSARSVSKYQAGLSADESPATAGAMPRVFSHPDTCARREGWDSEPTRLATAIKGDATATTIIHRRNLSRAGSIRMALASIDVKNRTIKVCYKT